MKSKLLILIFFILCQCTTDITKYKYKSPFTTKGFAYIYEISEIEKKDIKKKLDPTKLIIFNNNLKKGTLIKIINPQNNLSMIIKNYGKANYPDFYKTLITNAVAQKLDIDKNLPLVEIIEIRKNKSFVAKKADIHQDEKKLSTNAPVTSVKISNISKNKKKTKKNSTRIFIEIAIFYSSETANFLKQRINKELPDFDDKKLIIKKINSKETQLLSGPYNSMNLVKNDYIQLKKYGFEELNVSIHD